MQAMPVVPSRSNQVQPRRAGLVAATLLRWIGVLLVVPLLGGCAETRYYWQSVHGHVQLLQAARPIDDWLGDAQTSAALKERLLLAQRMREFAVRELALPDNPSYRRYVQLQRRAVVWNVVAAPTYSLTLKTWCFPVAGCVSYRGYFDEAQARAYAAQLQAEGLEVSVYGVPAYSTLGWMNWAGGDPLLSTFIQYPEGELARLLFHELAHQVLYVPDDTVFNESFATAVERLGGARWLAAAASDTARREFAAFDLRRQQFRGLRLGTRERLRQVYAMPNAASNPDATRAKDAAMEDFRLAFADLRTAWGGFAGYDQQAVNANNASFGAQGAYEDLVPAFEALFEREGRNWPSFYDAVKRLAEKPAAERSKILRTMKPVTETHGG